MFARGLLSARRALARLRRARLVALGGAAMGTTWSVRVAARGTLDEASLRAAIEAELASVVAQMSPWEAASDLSRYNRAEAGARCVLPPGFQEVLACALAMARESDGAFDPTVGPLVDLWGFGPHGTRREPPPADDIASARARCGWWRLDLDATASVLCQPGGLALDLCSIAKGYAVDEIARCLERHGCADYLVEVGGELRARGRRPDGLHWRVALEEPASDASPAIVALDDGAIATSGDYYRYFDEGERRYSHTIDPRNGEPVAHGLACVSVAHSRAMSADAYATALTVLGAETGYTFAVERGIAARFVTRTRHGYERIQTPAMAALMQGMILQE